MATEPLDHRSPAASVEELAAPSLKGTRAQAMQRLQVGLFGIASMVLLVGLANVVLTNARQNEAQVVPEAVSPAATPQGKVPSDPLAEAGIVPDLPVATPTETQIEIRPPAILAEPTDAALSRP
ncbi:MAG TPA: hypothetical protein VNR60_09820 [Croceibacterium sp.]|nr:hypothetical protein [Croceibacterium sp.]